MKFRIFLDAVIEVEGASSIEEAENDIWRTFNGRTPNKLATGEEVHLHQVCRIIEPQEN